MANIVLDKNSFGSIGVTKNQMHINLHIIELLNTTKQKFDAAIDNLNVFILNWNFFMTTLLDEETAKKYQIEFILSESEKQKQTTDEVDLSKIQFGDVDSLLTNMTQRISAIKARYDWCVNKDESYNIWTPQKFKVRVKNTSFTSGGKSSRKNHAPKGAYDDEGVKCGAYECYWTEHDTFFFGMYESSCTVGVYVGSNKIYSNNNLLSCLKFNYETHTGFGSLYLEKEAKKALARSTAKVVGTYHMYIRFLAK